MSKSVFPSLNARNVFNPAIAKVNKAKSKVDGVIGKGTSAVNKATGLNIDVKIPSIGSARVANTKFFKVLDQMNRPIDRFQQLGQNLSSRLKKSIDLTKPFSNFQNTLKQRLSSSINRAISQSINLGSLSPIKSLPSTIFKQVASIPKQIIGSVASTAKAFVSHGAAMVNSTLGMISSSLGNCGIISNFLKSAINGLMSSVLQMQRSVLAAIDSAANEVISVIEKATDKFLSLLPEINFDFLDKINLEKLIPDKLKSLVAEISKIIPIVNRIMKEIANCAALLGSAVAMVKMFDGLFNGNSGSSNGGSGSGSNNNAKASDQLSFKNKITSTNNLGNIGNVKAHLDKYYPGTVSSTITSQTNTNRDGILLETDKAHQDLTNSNKNIKDELNNIVLEETLNPELQEVIDEIVEYFERILPPIIELLEEVYRRVKYIYLENKNIISNNVSELKKTLTLLHEFYENSTGIGSVISPEELQTIIDKIKTQYNRDKDVINLDNLQTILEELEKYYEKVIDGSADPSEIQNLINRTNNLVNELTVFTKIPLNEVKDTLSQIKDLLNTLDTIKKDVDLIKNELMKDTVKHISDNLKIVLDGLDEIQKEIDETMAEQKKDLNNIFDALEREAQLIDQDPVISEEKDDSCQVSYRDYV